MTVRFGDVLSNALHDIKQLTGKKISILQDEIGYTFDPPISGDTIEKWRYRKTSLSAGQLETLAKALLAYNYREHNREWLITFLQTGGITYADAIADQLGESQLTAKPVPQEASQLTIAPAPPIDAYRAPALEGFIGRRREIEEYLQQLNSDGIAPIFGMAGMGKTSIALSLSESIAADKPVFWHRFYDQNLNDFVRRLAGFLTHFDRNDLWEMLESARLAKASPPDLVTSFDLLYSQLTGLKVAIFLDDLQFVIDQPEIERFLGRLVEVANRDSINLIFTSRLFPTFLPNQNRVELRGLSLSDTHQLLEMRDIRLSPDLERALHSVTEGSGAFLTLAAVALNRSQDPADLIGRLASIENIERFLLEEVNDRLESQEQRVMEGVAILSGYPGTRDALEMMLNQRDVRRTLRQLADQFLLSTQEGEFGREYNLHQILQAFYYEQLTRSKRQQLHSRAAKFYSAEEVDHLKAVLHHVKAGQSEQGLEIALNHLWEIVNLGLAPPLLQSLEAINAHSLGQHQLLDLWLVQGQLDQLLGDYDNAAERYQLAARTLQSLEKTAKTDRLKGRVCLHMGELLERQDPPEALRWVQRGIDLLGVGESELHIQLHVQQGTIMMFMGNSAGALESTLVDPDHLETLPIDLQIQIHKNLGGIYFNLDQLDQSVLHSEQALQLSRQTRNHFQTSRIYINLGPTKYMLGNWAGAIQDLEEALAIAKRLGSHQVVMALHVNLGRCYVDKGEDALAHEHLERAIELSPHSGSLQLVAARINLARLALFNRDFSAAEALLSKANRDALSKNDQLSLNTIKMMQAECFVNLKDFPAAIEQINDAKKMAKQLGDDTNLANLLRLEGQIATSKNDLEAAQQAFGRSVEILEVIDQYQAAFAKLIWGENMLALNQQQTGESLIQEAYQVFEQLGALREIRRSQDLLVS